MGDISEIRGLLVGGSFLAITVLLITWIPPEFYATQGQRTIKPPDYFESSEVIVMNYTYLMNITSGHFEDWWGKEEFGYDMLFEASTSGTYYIDGEIYSGHWMLNRHGYTFWGMWTGGHKQEWINDEGISRGKVLEDGEIESDWDDQKNLASYTVKCKHFYMLADIGYNTTAYSSVSDAWDDDDLRVLFGINWDQRGTTWDAWSLIAGILFFKLPQIHPYINAMIAIPLWIAVAYISFILVLRAIGAIFGGGA